MKKIMCLLTLLFALLPSVPVAASAPLQSLMFRDVKLKGEDFIVLQATTNNVKLDEYWLGYDSSAPLDAISPEYRLAAVTLQAGQAVMLVNDDAVPTCDALYSMDMPFDLTETKGTVGLWHRTTDNATASITYSRVDSFNWTTTATAKADIVRPDAVEKDYSSADPLVLPVWFRDLGTGTTTWNAGGLQFDADSNCVVRTKSGVSQQYSDTSSNPPSIDDTPTTSDSDEAVDGDLSYPLITELLPNPSGSGTDATDEFIELYNPNSEPFPLDGYTLQTGTTTKHSYIFPAATYLVPGYTAFYAEDTGLSMSNTSGQARLLDADGGVVAETAAYDGADDGVAWVSINGSWQWTTSSTPGVANIAAEPVKIVTAAAVKSATTTATKKAAAVKTASTKKATTKTSTSKATTASKGVASEATKPVRGIHPLVLVGILLAAVGYGVYEHRQDLANSLYQFKSNRATRRSNRH